MGTQVTPCQSCTKHLGKKSIDDVHNDCYQCVWEHKTTGVWSFYDPVDKADFNKQVQDWEEFFAGAEEDEIIEENNVTLRFYRPDPKMTDKEIEQEMGWQGHNPIFVDNVNHPKHYTVGGIETIDFIKAKLGTEGTIAYCLGNVIKYVTRWKDKGGLEDLKKAQWYLNYAVNTKELYASE